MTSSHATEPHATDPHHDLGPDQRWINPYQLTARGYETMVLICEARIQVFHDPDVLGLPTLWRFVGNEGTPPWADQAYRWATRYIRAGLVKVSAPDGRDWAPLCPTMAGIVLLDIWRDHPFTVFEHPTAP